ncbi:ABC transporter permease [Mesorhizobium loti]|uniref:Transport system permease n=2 Tax=Mesorhizobium TaxID=68287 RepID=M5AMQ0_RHILI|nr:MULTISPECIES: ABC transporter permease [Mesorhizobium]ANN60951.1 ABC transporter permease [Mesorhizobium loti NZP2037]OBP78240.1 ABC transporter permease [Mesorhizobium loti]OBP85581.1 ABC transporter permease [Mesorhizobium loti]OBP96931.1 ABC transporter permease [Mesorhizobium loti]OBQ68072.1 ABC transporter permease [Mesorhizobium loti]
MSAVFRFAGPKILRAGLSILIVVTFTFVVLRASGDPALQILGPSARAPDLEAFRRHWGLDRPLYVQYVRYVLAALHCDFGNSMLAGKPALQLVFERVPLTLALMLPALALTMLIGIPVGAYAAMHRDTWVDRSVMMLTVFGFTVPSFVLGLLLILIFSVTLGLFPSGGADRPESFVLPVLTLGLGGAAIIARFTRSAMIEVLSQLYIVAASAKGVTWRQVVRHHAFPNAIIPVLTLFGLMLGGQVAGAVLVESVFGWPGIGQLLVVSVANRDLAVVQVILLLVALTMTSANLLMDLLYGVFDPRLRGTNSGSQ